MSPNEDCGESHIQIGAIYAKEDREPDNDASRQIDDTLESEANQFIQEWIHYSFFNSFFILLTPFRN